MGFWDWFWLVYWVGLIPAWLVFSEFMLKIGMEDSWSEKPNSGDRFAAVGLGFCLCWFWPLGIPFVAIWKALDSDD